MKKEKNEENFLEKYFKSDLQRRRNPRKLFFPQRVMTSSNVHKNIFPRLFVCARLFYSFFVVAYYFERRGENNKSVFFLDAFGGKSGD